MACIHSVGEWNIAVYTLACNRPMQPDVLVPLPLVADTFAEVTIHIVKAAGRTGLYIYHRLSFAHSLAAEQL